MFCNGRCVSAQFELIAERQNSLRMLAESTAVLGKAAEGIMKASADRDWYKEKLEEVLKMTQDVIDQRDLAIAILRQHGLDFPTIN